MPGTTSAHDQARSRAYRWGEDGLAGTPTTSNVSALPWPFGTARTRFSKNACLD